MNVCTGPLLCCAFEGPKGFFHGAWRGCNNREVSARCSIRCDALLLPISQAPDRDLESIGELMLSEAELPAQLLDLRHRDRLGQLRVVEGLYVRGWFGSGDNLLIGHRRVPTPPRRPPKAPFFIAPARFLVGPVRG